MSFEYIKPESLKNASELLKEYGEDAHLIAGGTDLLVQIKDGDVQPQYLIDLKSIKDELDYIDLDRDALRIGSGCTLSEILRSEVVRDKCNVLFQAVREMGSVQIRNIATVGGNICNASPAADTATPLLVLNAEVKIVSEDGERLVPLDEFFEGPGAMVLSEGEILSEVIIPEFSFEGEDNFLKQKRRKAFSLAVVNSAFKIFEKDGLCEEVRIGLGAVAPTPIRASQAEDYLEGREINVENIEKTAESAQELCTPITDVRACDEYRNELIYSLVKKGLSELVGLSMD